MRATRTGPTSSRRPRGPYATSVFPLAVNPGATASLRAEGFNFDAEQTIALDVPDGDAPRPLADVARHGAGTDAGRCRWS